MKVRIKSRLKGTSTWDTDFYMEYKEGLLVEVEIKQ